MGKLFIKQFKVPSKHCNTYLNGSKSKESACNAGDAGFIPRSRRSRRVGNSNPLQWFCLENPMDRGAWRATAHMVTKSQTQLKRSTVQFSSVAQLCLILCDPMNHSTPGLPVHQVGDAIQPSHPLSSPSPPAPNPSQHQGLFRWVSSLHRVAKVLEFQL